MREIEFRAWCIEEKRMYSVLTMEQINTKHWHIYSQQGDVFSINQVILTQFTGLYDKNGNKIYEGDILEFRGSKGVIKWDNEYSRFIITYVEYILGDKIENSFSIVLGNIFQNVDILPKATEINPMSYAF